MYDAVTAGLGLSLTLAPYISLLFEFRSHLLLAADSGGHHAVRAHAWGFHQRGGAVQADGRQYQHWSPGFRCFTGRPAVCIRWPWGQHLDHQKWQKVCFLEKLLSFHHVFYRTVVVHYINTYNTYKNTYNLYSNVTKRLKRFQILKWNEYYFDTVQGTEVEFLQKKVIICLKGVNVLKISSFLHTESQGVWLRYCVISLWIATLWHVPVKLVTVSLLDLLWDICSWKWAWPRAIQETFHIKSTPVEKVTLPIDWDKLL